MREEDRDNRSVEMLFVCKDHLELAIDIIVDEYEKSPAILTLEQAGLAGEQPPKRCGRCDQQAQFTVS